MIDAYLVNIPEGESQAVMKWHTFPTKKEALAGTLEDLKVTKDSEFFISRCSTKIDELGEFILPHLNAENIDKLNFLADKLKNTSQEQLETFTAILASDRHCDSIDSLIHLADNLDCFDIQPAFSPKEYGAFHINLARDEFADKMNALEASNNPDDKEFFTYIAGIEQHVDLTAYGKQIAENEGGFFTDVGYITEDGRFTKHFRDVPDALKVFEIPNTEQPKEKPSVLQKIANAFAERKTDTAEKTNDTKTKTDYER